MFQDVYNKIKKEIPKLKNLCDDACEIREDCIFSSQNELIDDIEKYINKLEILALDARELLAETGMREPHECKKAILRDTFDIKIEITEEGWVKVRLPIVKAHSKHPAQFIRMPLWAALEDYFSEYRDKTGKKFIIENGVMIFKFYYPSSLPEDKCSDIDNLGNYEIKGIVNDIAFFTLPDDGPFRCGQCYFADRAEKFFTEVFVIPDTDLEKWAEVNKLNGKINSDMAKQTTPKLQ